MKLAAQKTKALRSTKKEKIKLARENSGRAAH
jgi:hypothetical protein